MIYSIPGFHRPGASLCAPVGGTAAVVDKLGGCLEKFGGSMELKKHVEEIIVEDGEATGVVLKGKSPTAEQSQQSPPPYSNTRLPPK